jgi:hypothetical protein
VLLRVAGWLMGRAIGSGRPPTIFIRRSFFFLLILGRKKERKLE